MTLTGTVPSYPQYLEAARAVMLPPSAVRDDAMLTTAANNGDLTLTGTVQYLSQRAIVGATWMARGVAMVVDKLEVTG